MAHHWLSFIYLFAPSSHLLSWGTNFPGISFTKVVILFVVFAHERTSIDIAPPGTTGSFCSDMSAEYHDIFICTFLLRGTGLVVRAIKSLKTERYCSTLAPREKAFFTMAKKVLFP